MLAVDSDLAGAGSSVASHTRLHSVELLVEVGNLPQQDGLPRPGPGLAVKPCKTLSIINSIENDINE